MTLPISLPILIGGAALLVLLIGILFWRMSRRGHEDERPPYLIALAALADGDQETAFAQFKNAVRVDSRNEDAYLRLGDLFRSRGEPQRAARIHRELASRSGLSDALRARIHHGLALDLMALGRPESAAASAKTAAALATQPLPALEVQLEALRARDDWEGALRVRKEILKLRGVTAKNPPELATFRAEQGRELLGRDELKEAEKILKDARRMDANNVLAATVWGQLKERQGDYAGAIQAWEEALRHSPADVEELFRGLERVRFLDGSFSEMGGTYTHYLESVPNDEAASFGLARFLRRKGRVNEAVEICRQALYAAPHSTRLRVLLLTLLSDGERTAEVGSTLAEWLSELLAEGGDSVPDETDAPAGGLVVENSERNVPIIPPTASTP